MGSQESKVEQPKETTVKETVLTESAPSSPILTPLDPRSPTVNIARTPLETVLGAKNTENCTNELKNDSKDAVNVILGIDPRSPTVEFNRTPIIVATVNKDKKLQNKNLENVRRLEIQTTPVSITKSSIVPPKLLDSSPVSIIPNYNKRKSFVGLLETNLDFTETDLDSVQTKPDLNQSLPVEITEDLPCNKLKDQMEALQIEGALTELGAEKCDKSDEKLEEKLVNITAQVKDFDKKLIHLIYEDDSDDNRVTMKTAKVRENNRTPLSVRNLNEDDKKAKSRLKVSDKPRKSDISKIPVFKDYHSKKMAIQCENTPPKTVVDAVHKTTVSHWDADKTLVI